MKTKRVLATMGVVVAAGIVPLTTASPASATVVQCVGVVHGYGYVVGPKVTTACTYKPLPNPLGSDFPNPTCVTMLVQLGITSSRANTACSWA
ncbi:hypothetical protein [Streptomyces sp. NBC_01451]|uniref:hypothetical protein n=1 Tax=Streptomyces sp. NBC_01451 TaxID=2903872 RepID=UPI002E35A760|nr:hypothetical protein [Streptomyces sp. NBC_01451]